MIRNGVALGVTALLAAACGSGSPSSSSRNSASSLPAARPAAAGTFKACLVTDTGGLGDRSFNALSWQGVQAAQAAEPAVITGAYLQPASASGYTPSIEELIGGKCGIIITVQLLMADNTQAAAMANPRQKFAIVDFAYRPPIANVDAIVFSTAQAGFLGGYLAAGMTKTGKVATYGAEPLPTVTGYMDGFWDGVRYYDRTHHADVAVLGWNEQTQDGSFTGNFTSQAEGQALTQTFIGEGADIIFPVAGDAGLGTATAVKDADASAGGDTVTMMWSDTDGCVSVPQYCRYFLTSVTKGIQPAVKTVILSAARGRFRGGTYVGDLANGGVSLAPFHDFAGQVPAALRAELAKIRAEIENGAIKPATKSPAT